MNSTNERVIALFKELKKIEKNEQNNNSKRKSEIKNNILKDMSYLVLTIAKKYKKFSNYEDLVQDGFIGLLKAINKFDVDIFPNFHIYSERWIKHYIKRSAKKFDIVFCPNKTKVLYLEDLDKNEDELCLETPEDIYFNKERTKEINKEISLLSLRNMEIIKKIYGLDNNHPQSLRKLGDLYDITHERVRQIKNESLSMIRKNNNMADLY